MREKLWKLYKNVCMRGKLWKLYNWLVPFNIISLYSVNDKYNNFRENKRSIVFISEQKKVLACANVFVIYFNYTIY